jgi:hypothetical protein
MQFNNPTSTKNESENMTTLHLRKSIIRSPLRLGLFLIPLALAWFALSPTAQAQLSPPPDGGYPGQNTAEGDNALLNLTTGGNNTALGFNALLNDTNGTQNTATGSLALSSNTMGNGNTAIGCQAVESNTTGSRNTATGLSALEENTAGNRNTANGYNALYYSTGSDNIGLGANAGVYLTTGSNNIDIGNNGIPSDAGNIRIGTQGMQTGTSIAGIYNVAVTGSAVVVNSTGKLGVSTSSLRFKDDIKPMDKASDAILALKPVTFRYKKEVDPDGAQQFGLVAEDVAKVNHDLVIRDHDGKPFTVRYDAVNAMLLNEFLKEHRKVEQLTKDFQSKLAVQQKQIEALTAGLQRVSDQLELSKRAPQMVNNNQ